MTIRILYVDTFHFPPIMEKRSIDWIANLTLHEAILKGFDPEFAQRIQEDLLMDNPHMGVSWIHPEDDDHSDIGGSGSLDWDVQDNTIVYILYENPRCSQEVISITTNWMLENGNTIV